MHRSGFDRLAWIYDSLAGLVFGNAIDAATSAFLDRLPPNSRVLVLGGGTGRFLPALLRMNPGVDVTFVDASARMIARARARGKPSSKVQFIHGTEAGMPNGPYDAVITAFYLDLFKEEQLREVVGVVTNQLKQDSTWLVAEFLPEKAWHRMMLRLMYGFFRVATGLKASVLPDWHAALRNGGWRVCDFRIYYQGFIEASRWQRGS